MYLSVHKNMHMCIRSGSAKEVLLKHCQGHMLSMMRQNGFLATQSGFLAPGEVGSRNNN